jgi:A/G-specific adenine glycosylase
LTAASGKAEIPSTAAAIQAPLLEWFRREQRDLPWRRTPDAYAIWVSEIMLQQTQVATVIPFFERWMARFPTVQALAEADEHDVLHAWQGLGYYSRARNLRLGAQQVLERHGGRVPDNVPALLELPGVGRYTAGAIASIAYNVPAPIVDGNVIRVLARLFALRGDPAKAPVKNRIWELAEALIPEGEARDFNPALMELGARICSPVNPRCASCPVAKACEARRLGIQERLPETAPRPQVTAVSMVAALAWRAGRVLVVQRRADEVRWAGMWQFPNAELLAGEARESGVRRAMFAAAGLEVVPGERATVVRHGVTRFRITLEAFHCTPLPGEPEARGCQAWRWAGAEELEGLALPKAHRTIADRIFAGQGAEETDGQLTLRIGD